MKGHGEWGAGRKRHKEPVEVFQLRTVKLRQGAAFFATPAQDYLYGSVNLCAGGREAKGLRELRFVWVVGECMRTPLV